MPLETEGYLRRLLLTGGSYLAEKMSRQRPVLRPTRLIAAEVTVMNWE